MADLAAEYTLATSGGTIVFNDGDLGDGTDKFWLHRVAGLTGPKVRAPWDNKPLTDGGLIHTFRRGPVRPLLEGVLLVESVALGTSLCQEKLNVLEAALSDAIDSIVAADGTLSWTPAGQGAKSLTVRYLGEPEFDPEPIENFALRSFVISLISETGAVP